MSGHAVPWPAQALRVPVTNVTRPRYPVISMHEHLGPVFGGDWRHRPVEELLATMDEVGIITMVDLDGGQGAALSRQVERYQAPHPDRVVVFAGLDYEAWSAEPSFGELEAARLRDSVARGARGLKVWKLRASLRYRCSSISPIPSPSFGPWTTTTSARRSWRCTPTGTSGRR